MCVGCRSRCQALTGLPQAGPTLFPLKLPDPTKNRNPQFLGREGSKAEVAGFSKFLTILDDRSWSPGCKCLIPSGEADTQGGGGGVVTAIVPHYGTILWHPIPNAITPWQHGNRGTEQGFDSGGTTAQSDPQILAPG